MIPAWFINKKYNYFISHLLLYIFCNYLVFIFINSTFLPFFASTTFIFGTALLLSRKGFKKRKAGLVVENKATQWLREELNKEGITIRAGVQMKYGDIDIYIPRLKTVIDVKSFRVIDRRVYEPKTLKSIHRQLKYVGADLAIIWLPYSSIKEVVHLSNNIYVVSGRNKIFELLQAQGKL